MFSLLLGALWPRSMPLRRIVNPAPAAADFRRSRRCIVGLQPRGLEPHADTERVSRGGQRIKPGDILARKARSMIRRRDFLAQAGLATALHAAEGGVVIDPKA